jgi:hypothetical protein
MSQRSLGEGLSHVVHSALHRDSLLVFDVTYSYGPLGLSFLSTSGTRFDGLWL